MQAFVIVVGFILAGGGLLMFIASIQSIRAFPLKNAILGLIALALIVAGVYLIMNQETILQKLLR
ncbi:MAG: hypothetical protein NC911_03450 [Candidatus Omnitrophica bacterium]|nr:hypothetical protein [Candidatus Omnitrophota bacterium]MCM8768723.1 hypothetical protein [Candidatus Omnitrophota bacterium]